MAFLQYTSGSTTEPRGVVVRHRNLSANIEAFKLHNKLSRVVMVNLTSTERYCEIEDDAVIGAQAGILPGKIVRSGQIVWGTPARALHKFKEQFAWFGRLPALAERVKKLEGRITTKSN